MGVTGCRYWILVTLVRSVSVDMMGANIVSIVHEVQALIVFPSTMVVGTP